MSASDLQALIRELLDGELRPRPDDCPTEELRGTDLREALSNVFECLTFEEAGVLSREPGLVVRTGDRQEFQISIVRSR